MPRDNGAPIGEDVRSDDHLTSMEEFDSLPAPMRKVLAEAPFDFSTRGPRLAIQEMGLEAVLAAAKKNARLWIAYSARKDYGPEHPQACDDGEGAQNG